MFSKLLRTTFTAAQIVFVLLFCSCHSGQSHFNRNVFIGSWREVRHLDNTFNDNYAITLTLNDDKSFLLSIPSSRIRLSGTWSVGGFDTVAIIALQYNYQVRDMDRDYYGGSNFPMYYFFKVNNAVKGKLYLVDLSNQYQEERIREHLFKPVE